MRTFRWRQSSSDAMALAIAATIMLVPANVLPVLSTEFPGQARTDTIFSGIVALCEQGLWPLGAIVFTASIVIPLMKLVGLGILLAASRRGPGEHARTYTRIYAFIDFIGRWSMLDVFLVAFLSGAVQFGMLATVKPQPGIIAFAAVVVLTVLATEAFDPRCLWTTRTQDSHAPAS